MRKIFKYRLEITDEQKIRLPLGSKILSVVNQRNEMVLYALVKPEEDRMVDHTFYIVGTGHYIQEEDIRHSSYLGTVTFGANQTFVWHIFFKEWA